MYLYLAKVRLANSGTEPYPINFDRFTSQQPVVPVGLLYLLSNMLKQIAPAITKTKQNNTHANTLSYLHVVGTDGI